MALQNIQPEQAATQLYADLNTIFNANQYDFMPILTKPITQHNGINVQGSFKFQDITAERIPPMCYVTVRRNANDPYPHNGFGFAFSKMSYSDVTSGIFNVYLVDNSPLVNNTFLYNESILQENGINNFLAAGSMELAQNTNYQFKMQINEYNSIKLWIVDDTVDLDTGLVDDWYDADTLTSGYIATSPARSSVYEPQASGTAFGIGVLGTRQTQWYFDDLQIYSTISNFPFVYFNIKIPDSLVGTTDPALLEWEGYGVWGNSPYTGTSGIQMWIQKTAGSWELVGSHTWTPDSPDITERKLSKEIADISVYNNGAGYLNAYVTTTEANNIARVYTDYIHLSSIAPSGIHTGNMLDIYVKDTSKIARATHSEVASTIYLDSSSLGPIVAVRSITNFNVQMVPGDPDIGYLVTSPVPDTAFSTNEQVKIAFGASTDAVIEYLYYTEGLAAQSYVNSNGLRYPGANLLVKVQPPTIVTIENLEYTGTLDVTTMQAKIVDYINSLPAELDISRLLLYMQSQGATAFNLDTISISVERYDYKRELQYKGPVTTSYVLTDMGMFYTDTTECLGVTKV